MTFLLDVNVRIALIDPAHVSHDAAREWFKSASHANWATCPITENGVLRIVGRSRYPNTPGSPAAVAPLLRKLCNLPGHEFWPDGPSLLNASVIDLAKILTSQQVTDSYLLALAAFHGGQLATFDSRLSPKAVFNGKKAHCLIG